MRGTQSSKKCTRYHLDPQFCLDSGFELGNVLVPAIASYMRRRQNRHRHRRRKSEVGSEPTQPTRSDIETRHKTMTPTTQTCTHYTTLHGKRDPTVGFGFWCETADGEIYFLVSSSFEKPSNTSRLREHSFMRKYPGAWAPFKTLRSSIIYIV